jgi:hypothetical protein
MPLGATQLVDLLAGNPGHPAFLTILDTTVDAAAMSMRDNDAAAADVRTQMSAQGAQVPEWPFRQRHLGQSEARRQRERCPSYRALLPPRRLVARGRQRHAGVVPVGDLGTCYGQSTCPIAILFTTKVHSLQSAESACARNCASADVCVMQSQASGA